MFRSASRTAAGLALLILIASFPVPVGAGPATPWEHDPAGWAGYFLDLTAREGLTFRTLTLTPVPAPDGRASRVLEVRVTSPEKFSRLSRYLDHRLAGAEMSDLTPEGGPTNRSVVFQVDGGDPSGTPGRWSGSALAGAVESALESVPSIALRSLTLAAGPGDHRFGLTVELEGPGPIPVLRAVRSIEDGGQAIEQSGLHLEPGPDRILARASFRGSWAVSRDLAAGDLAAGDLEARLRRSMALHGVTDVTVEPTGGSGAHPGVQVSFETPDDDLVWRGLKGVLEASTPGSVTSFRWSAVPPGRALAVVGLDGP